jgi:LacI family transcriptional regulator
MRPTTKDLAKLAGVSLATVDRVLNQRPNTSEDATRKVKEAIKKIGFVRNIAAVNLVKNTIYRFRFILPDTGDQFIDEIVREIEAARLGIMAEMVALDIVRLPIEEPHLVANHLLGLVKAGFSGVAIMAPEFPQVRDAIARIISANVKVVRLLSGNSGREGIDVIGVNNRAAGATAARLLGRFNCRRGGKIIAITETLRAQDSIERRLGFDEVIQSSFPELVVLPSLETHADVARTERILEQSLQNNSDISGIYVMSAEARIPITFISRRLNLDNIVTIVHEKTPFTVEALGKGKIDAIISQNPGDVVRSAVRILKARSINFEPVKEQEQVHIDILLQDNV